mmetsp:Transcript_9185/g.28160  ORF Transcript_9185/g.28160 Transcript_9185/m.28160 type:complete len:125 (+) Transcript_9185:102-476(+)
MEDEAAIKAEAASIVAAARRDLEERTKAQEAAKNAKTPEELQALINSRLKSSMAGRSSVVSNSPPPGQPAGVMVGTSPSIKAEAAAVVATAQRERNERIAAQKAVKKATPEEIQAMINARLNAR